MKSPEPDRLPARRHPAGGIRMRFLTCFALLSLTLLASPAATANALQSRIEALDQRLAALVNGQDDARWQIQDCGNYPYHDNPRAGLGERRLINDLRRGLRQGLYCLAGQSDAGRLHPFHENKAVALLKLLESPLPKTIRCVADESYAFAMARLPPQPENINAGFDELAPDAPFPALVVDTYRISGFLSGKHEPPVYRDFFKMDERQIDAHLNGQPQRLRGMHRYRDRASLLFHEMTHWLGFTHGNLEPDVVTLYETCCFHGSDFIRDRAQNRRFQDQACEILRDAELWEASTYRQTRLWHYKGYDNFRREMSAAYD